MPVVLFQPEGCSVEVDSGATLRDAARQAGVSLYWGPRKIVNCRGRGRCGGCRVEVVEGTDELANPTNREIKTLRREKRSTAASDPAGSSHDRLACQAQVKGPVTVSTARSSRGIRARLGAVLLRSLGPD